MAAPGPLPSAAGMTSRSCSKHEGETSSSSASEGAGRDLGDPRCSGRMDEMGRRPRSTVLGVTASYRHSDQKFSCLDGSETLVSGASGRQCATESQAGTLTSQILAKEARVRLRQPRRGSPSHPRPGSPAKGALIGRYPNIAFRIVNLECGCPTFPAPERNRPSQRRT
jgi:hypothetical protein